MNSLIDSSGLEGMQAIVLHPEHSGLSTLLRQLRAIGLEVSVAWPELPVTPMPTGYILYDTDTGHDGQFPWPAGEAPLPMIALVGSEAPGRIEWASRTGADALLVKPLAANGVFAALLLARQSFERRKGLLAQVDALRTRLMARQTIVQAVAILSAKTGDQDTAYDRLRQLAMAWQMTMEDAAVQIVENENAMGRYREGR